VRPACRRGSKCDAEFRTSEVSVEGRGPIYAVAFFTERGTGTLVGGGWFLAAYSLDGW